MKFSKKIAIVNSPLFRDLSSINGDLEDSLPPIGLGYIATSLKDKGFTVFLIDSICHSISFPEILHRLESISPDYIATNIFSTNYLIVKELIESYSGNSKFIIGGIATRGLFNQIFNWDTKNHIDIVIGDGEIITPDIVSNLIKESPYKQIANRRVFLVDKNSVYFNANISTARLDRSFFTNEPVLNHFNQKEVSIITSRGCIYDCAFCGAARSQNKDQLIRYRSLDSIVGELNQIQEVFPDVMSIRILDDLFLKSTRNIEQAIQIFNNTSFNWRSMAHVRTFLNSDQSLIEDLKKCGCRELFIGIESGSRKILERINKKFTVENVYDSLEKIFKAKIDVKGYFIFGFPNENGPEMESTFKLAKNLKKIAELHRTEFRTSVFQFRPYHGTRLFSDLRTSYSEEELINTEPNFELTEMIGRMQYNFQGKNFSDVEPNVIHDYICRTNALNVPGKSSTAK